MPATRQPDDGCAPPTRARNSRMKRLAGRLNLFQRTMLDWRELHPYNAMHAAEISRPLEAVLQNGPRIRRVIAVAAP